MLETSARLLELLSLLQLRRDWTSSALADRLGVSTRTVRADIGKLPGVPRGGGLSGPRRRDRDGVSHRAMVSENDQELTQKDDTARWLLTSLPSSSCSGN